MKYDQKIIDSEIIKFLAEKAIGVYHFNSEELKKDTYWGGKGVAVWNHRRAEISEDGFYYDHSNYSIETFKSIFAKKFEKAAYKKKIVSLDSSATLEAQIEHWGKGHSDDYGGVDWDGYRPKVKAWAAFYDTKPQVFLAACTDDDLYWLIDQPIWRDYEKWNILTEFTKRRLKDKKVLENADINMLMPVLGLHVTKKQYIEEEVFPFTGESLRLLHQQYDIIIQVKHTCAISSKIKTAKRNSICGINLKEEGGQKYSVSTKNWITVPLKGIKRAYEKALSYQADNKRLEYAFDEKNKGAWTLAYYMFLSKEDVIPKEGNLYEWMVVLNTAFGEREWDKNVQDNSYKTHSYGWVPSFSGGETFDDCGITVKGYSSEGNPSVLTKYGTVRFTRKMK